MSWLPFGGWNRPRIIEYFTHHPARRGGISYRYIEQQCTHVGPGAVADIAWSNGCRLILSRHGECCEYFVIEILTTSQGLRSRDYGITRKLGSNAFHIDCDHFCGCAVALLRDRQHGLAKRLLSVEQTLDIGRPKCRNDLVGKIECLTISKLADKPCQALISQTTGETILCERDGRRRAVAAGDCSGSGRRKDGLDGWAIEGINEVQRDSGRLTSKRAPLHMREILTMLYITEVPRRLAEKAQLRQSIRQAVNDDRGIIGGTGDDHGNGDVGGGLRQIAVVKSREIVTIPPGNKARSECLDGFRSLGQHLRRGNEWIRQRYDGRRRTPCTIDISGPGTPNA